MSVFTGELKDGKVHLDWVTVSESNNDYFDVQHSLDGKNWEAIGRVNGVGNSSSNLYYSLVHENPASGTNYYRIKQVDFDGAFQFHKMVAVDVSKGHMMSVFYRENKVGVLLQDFVSTPENFAMYNVQGEEINLQPIFIRTDNSTYEIDAGNLGKGIYLLNYLSASGESETVKIHL